jgi:hypothetical protein
MQCHHMYDGQVQRSEEGKSNTATATHSITTPDQLVNKMLLQRVLNKLLSQRAITKLAKKDASVREGIELPAKSVQHALLSNVKIVFLPMIDCSAVQKAYTTIVLLITNSIKC